MESGSFDVNHGANPPSRENYSSGNSSPRSSSPNKNNPPKSPMRHSAPSPPSPDEMNCHDRGDHEDSGAVSPSSNKHSALSGIKIKKQYSKIYRIRTKILQNLGKADKTTDDVFDEYETNFNKQQLNANRLHKEVTNYLRCARALHGASKALFETLSEVYEPEWVGHDLMYVQAQNSDMMWTDFCHKLQDQSLGPLTAYTQDFPEIRKKIDKRGRKLVDYDSQRHQLENLQRSARRDEYKIARVKDQLESARSTYETLNKELYDELPSIYDHRIPNTANCLQTLFAAEATFMQESSKIAQEVEAIAEKLSKECDRGTYNSRRGTPPRSSRPTSMSTPSPTSPHTPTVHPTISSPVTRKEESGRSYEEIEFEEKKVNGTSPKANGEVVSTQVIPTGATTEDLPPGVLYRVRATYKYTREDVDELGFDVGETIQVVEYDDPEEQEEGWLCGVKESSNEKGLFPANFTRPI